MREGPPELGEGLGADSPWPLQRGHGCVGTVARVPVSACDGTLLGLQPLSAWRPAHPRAVNSLLRVPGAPRLLVDQASTMGALGPAGRHAHCQGGGLSLGSVPSARTLMWQGQLIAPAMPPPHKHVVSSC